MRYTILKHARGSNNSKLRVRGRAGTNQENPQGYCFILQPNHYFMDLSANTSGLNSENPRFLG